jgi:hypothetical protein
LVGILLAEAQAVFFPKPDNPFFKRYGKAYYRARTEILMMLNLSESTPALLNALIRELDGQLNERVNPGDGTFNNLCEAIIETSRQIEKTAWRDAKSDAKSV